MICIFLLVVPKSQIVVFRVEDDHLNFLSGFGAWFVSHCNTQSRREVVVQELKKYLPEDSIKVAKYKLTMRTRPFFLNWKNPDLPFMIGNKKIFENNDFQTGVVFFGKLCTKVLCKCSTRTRLFTISFSSIPINMVT